MKPERKNPRDPRGGRHPNSGRPSPRPGANPPGGTSRAATGPPRRIVAIVASVVVLALAIFALARGWIGLPGSPSGSTNAARMRPAEAYANATQLETAGQHVRSLSFYRRALEAADLQTPNVRREYAAALNNAALEVRKGPGGDVFAARSNGDRIEFACESLRQLDRALGETSDPALRALLLDDSGRTYEWWGLTWDALTQFSAAYRAAPRSKEIRDHAMRCAALIMVDSVAAR